MQGKSLPSRRSHDKPHFFIIIIDTGTENLADFINPPGEGPHEKSGLG
jgi:hypothetical protein